MGRKVLCKARLDLQARPLGYHCTPGPALLSSVAPVELSTTIPPGCWEVRPERRIGPVSPLLRHNSHIWVGGVLGVFSCPGHPLTKPQPNLTAAHPSPCYGVESRGEKEYEKDVGGGRWGGRSRGGWHPSLCSHGQALASAKLALDLSPYSSVS